MSKNNIEITFLIDGDYPEARVMTIGVMPPHGTKGAKIDHWFSIMGTDYDNLKKQYKQVSRYREKGQPLDADAQHVLKQEILGTYYLNA